MNTGLMQKFMFRLGIKVLAELRLKGVKEYVAVLPCFDEAKRVANLALNPIVGGFQSATLTETTDAITHECAEEWL